MSSRRRLLLFYFCHLHLQLPLGGIRTLQKGNFSQLGIAAAHATRSAPILGPLIRKSHLSLSTCARAQLIAAVVAIIVLPVHVNRFILSVRTGGQSPHHHRRFIICHLCQIRPSPSIRRKRKHLLQIELRSMRTDGRTTSVRGQIRKGKLNHGRENQ